MSAKAVTIFCRLAAMRAVSALLPAAASNTSSMRAPATVKLRSSGVPRTRGASTRVS
jgi:hypothetical protein